MPVKRQPDVKVIFTSCETGTRDYVKFTNFLSCGINILLRRLGKAMSTAVILYLKYINLKNIQSFHVLSPDFLM